MRSDDMPAAVASIKAMGANSGRYAVLINGERRIVSAELIATHALKPGRLLSDEELATLDEDVRALAVFDRAARLLAVRAYGSGELRRRLMRDREISAQDVTHAVDRLKALGLIDDSAYALQRARSLAQRSGMSRSRIAQDLARRGLDRSRVDQAISQLAMDAAESGQEGEVDAALAAATKRMRSLQSLDPVTQTRRLTAFLGRRGFTYSDISEVLRRLRVRTDDHE